ncbi:MAG: peptidoglycan-binding domain-containing protein [Bryobacteraceae bacterium]
MARTLSAGMSGPDVTALQQLLNARPPSNLPALRVDGIFGSKTQARVMEFQRNNGLKADGIAGPLTMAKLASGNVVKPRGKTPCGNTVEGVRGQGQMIAAQFISELRRAQGGNQQFALTSSIGSPVSAGLFGSILPTFRPPNTTQAKFITDVFGSSIDLSRVFISDKKGPTGRPFTAFIGDPSGLGIGPSICVMNCGDEGNLESTIVHEATHVWQSQHASNPAKYIENCLGSQALAVELNLAEAALRGSPFPNSDFPGFFPNDAYAFAPGKRFSEYAGEQIAFQVEKGVVAIRNHVKGVRAGVVDADNDTSLSTKRVQDTRVAGVVHS